MMRRRMMMRMEEDGGWRRMKNHTEWSRHRIQAPQAAATEQA
jgi:hypothetical protein